MEEKVKNNWAEIDMWLIKCWKENRRKNLLLEIWRIKRLLEKLKRYWDLSW